MADQKVSQLANIVTPLGTDELYIVASGLSKAISMNDLANFLAGLSGYSLIQEQLLGSDVASVAFQNIPQTFRNLVLKCYARHSEAVSDNYLRMRFNNDSGANYDYQHAFFVNATTSISATYTQTSFIIGDVPGNNSTRNTQMGFIEINIPHYTGTTFEKLAICHSGGTWLTAGDGTGSQIESGGWRSTAAISRIDVFPTAGNLKAGSLFSLYGTR